MSVFRNLREQLLGLTSSEVIVDRWEKINDHKRYDDYLQFGQRLSDVTDTLLGLPLTGVGLQLFAGRQDRKGTPGYHFGINLVTDGPQSRSEMARICLNLISNLADEARARDLNLRLGHNLDNSTSKQIFNDMRAGLVHAAFRLGE